MPPTPEDNQNCKGNKRLLLPRPRVRCALFKGWCPSQPRPLPPPQVVAGTFPIRGVLPSRRTPLFLVLRKKKTQAYIFAADKIHYQRLLNCFVYFHRGVKWVDIVHFEGKCYD